MKLLFKHLKEAASLIWSGEGWLQTVEIVTPGQKEERGAGSPAEAIWGTVFLSKHCPAVFFTVYLVDLHCITLYHNVHCTCLLMFMVLYWTCTKYKPAPQYLVSWLANSRVICSTILLNRSQSQRCSQSSKQPNAGHAGQDSRPQAKAEVNLSLLCITLTHTHTHIKLKLPLWFNKLLTKLNRTLVGVDWASWASKPQKQKVPLIKFKIIISVKANFFT